MKSSGYIFASEDNGMTWHERSLIAQGITEVCLLNSKGVLFASARTLCKERMDSALPHGSGEKLFRSEDGGVTWDNGRLVSPQGQENANLLELKDGRLLYCFTSRCESFVAINKLVFKFNSQSLGQTFHNSFWLF